MKNISFGLIILFITACSPHVRTNLFTDYLPLEKEQEIIVLDVSAEQPEKAILLGTVQVDDSGFSINCGWGVVIEKARAEARQAGGNMLKIIFHRPPDFLSPCHRITANILWVENLQYFKDNDLGTNAPVKKNEDYYKFTASINGGWAYRLGRISDDVPTDLRDHVRKLKRGYNLSADAGYFFSENMGVGAKAVSFRSSQETEDITREDVETGLLYTGTFKEDITINYIAPSYLGRITIPDQRTNLYFSVSLGYLYYLSEFSFIQDVTITQGTLGFAYDVSGDIMFSDNIAFNLGISLLGGSLSKYKVSDGTITVIEKLPSDEQENISHIDISAGLRFYF